MLTISKQTKVVALIGIVCVAGALIWQNSSHLTFELTRSRAAVKHDTAGDGTWDPGALYVHHPVGSNILFLIGIFGLLFALPSLVGDIKRSRQVDRPELEHE